MIVGVVYDCTVAFTVTVVFCPRLSVAVTVIGTLPDVWIVLVVTVLPLYDFPSTDTSYFCIDAPYWPAAVFVILSLDHDCTYPVMLLGILAASAVFTVRFFGGMLGTDTVHVTDFVPIKLPFWYVSQYIVPLPDVWFGIWLAKSSGIVHLQLYLTFVDIVPDKLYHAYRTVCVNESEA